MTAAALLRRLAQPALDAYQNTVTVTVPTRLLTALADQLDATVDAAPNLYRQDRFQEKRYQTLKAALAEVERAAKEHTSQ